MEGLSKSRIYSIPFKSGPYFLFQTNFERMNSPFCKVVGIMYFIDVHWRFLILLG